MAHSLKTALCGGAIALAACSGSAQMTEPDTPPADLSAFAEAYGAFDMQRCVNMGNTLEAPANGDWGDARLDHADFAKISAKGFDTIRLPVRWSDYTGPGPDFALDPGFSAEVKSYVDAALAADLNVILNIHHFEQINETPETELDKLTAMWTQIGELFAGYPDDLWFETLNEPNNKLEGEIMRRSQAVAVEVIRAQHPKRIVILGGEFWSNWRQLDTNMAPPDENIVYTFHYYEPFDFTHYKAEWTQPNMPDKERSWGSAQDKAELNEAITSVAAYRERVNRPVFLGEFGVYTTIKNEDRTKWAEAVRIGMEEAGIPWCLWAYANTFPIYSYDREAWDEDMLEALGL